MTVRTLQQAPSPVRLYVTAAAAALRDGRGGALPDVQLRLPDVGVDRTRLADYTRVCGLRNDGTLPVTYPHVLAFPAKLQLMADPAFPFPLPGLVHVRNRITRRRVIGVTERLDLRVSATDLRPHRRGRLFDVVAEASADGEPVWTSRSTYLHRDGEAHPDAAAEGPAREPDPDAAPTAVWEVPADTGRRYAAVSGDLNPIHLSAVSARLFGFPRAIAHGMWTKARVLADLEGRLPAALHVDVRFKRPLLLPGTVVSVIEGGGDTWTVGVRDADDATPHLAGTVDPA